MDESIDVHSFECAICIEPIYWFEGVSMWRCEHFYHEECSRKWCDNSWPRYPTCPVCREHDASPIVTCAEPNLPVHQLVERIVRQQRAPFVVDVHWCVFQHVVDPADANAIVDAIEIGGVIASIGCIELSEAAFDATDELLRCCTLYASPGKNKEEISTSAPKMDISAPTLVERTILLRMWIEYGPSFNLGSIVLERIVVPYDWLCNIVDRSASTLVHFSLHAVTFDYALLWVDLGEGAGVWEEAREEGSVERSVDEEAREEAREERNIDEEAREERNIDEEAREERNIDEEAREEEESIERSATATRRNEEDRGKLLSCQSENKENEPVFLITSLGISSGDAHAAIDAAQHSAVDAAPATSLLIARPFEIFVPHLSSSSSFDATAHPTSPLTGDTSLPPSHSPQAPSSQPPAFFSPSPPSSQPPPPSPSLSSSPLSPCSRTLFPEPSIALRHDRLWRALRGATHMRTVYLDTLAFAEWDVNELAEVVRSWPELTRFDLRQMRLGVRSYNALLGSLRHCPNICALLIDDM